MAKFLSLKCWIIIFLFGLCFQVILEDPIETERPDSDFQSAISSQSVFMPTDGYKPRYVIA
jgi:hypothetical protein